MNEQLVLSMLMVPAGLVAVRTAWSRVGFIATRNVTEFEWDIIRRVVYVTFYVAWVKALVNRDDPR